MKRLIFITLIGLLSCIGDSNAPHEKNLLLTSTNWTVLTEEADTKKLEEILTFNNDGSYTHNFDFAHHPQKTIIKGTWKWISADEISTLGKSMMIDDVAYDLGGEESDSFVLRIAELNKERLHVIRRHNGDAENSGFAYPLSYVAVAK